MGFRRRIPRCFPLPLRPPPRRRLAPLRPHPPRRPRPHRRPRGGGNRPPESGKHTCFSCLECVTMIFRQLTGLVLGSSAAGFQSPESTHLFMCSLASSSGISLMACCSLPMSCDSKHSCSTLGSDSNTSAGSSPPGPSLALRSSSSSLRSSSICSSTFSLARRRIRCLNAASSSSNARLYSGSAVWILQ